MQCASVGVACIWKTVEAGGTRYGEHEMILRLFLLLTLIGQVGPRATDDEAERKLGGRGFANVMMIVFGLGVIVLAIVVVVAILALFGQFDYKLMDPVT